MVNEIKCPRCNSIRIQVLGQGRKGFSLGKAIVGGILTGRLSGMLVGFAGKQGKYDVFCCDCGCRYQFK